MEGNLILYNNKRKQKDKPREGEYNYDYYLMKKEEDKIE